jgi:hypothetical protein
VSKLDSSARSALSTNRSGGRLRAVIPRSVVCSFRNRGSVEVECAFVFVQGRRREGVSIYRGRLCWTTVSVHFPEFGFFRVYGTHLGNSCCQMRSREKTHETTKRQPRLDPCPTISQVPS